MKKIHILLLKAFIRPFIVTFFIVMFILLMFFLFKYVDDLIGKGFEWYTIVELMFYASAANVSMALPLAILLSSIMTFGTLGENYELVAIKSAGISLQKAMRPLFVLIIGIAFSSFLFSEYMLPKANLKFGSLLWDVRNKKLSFLIKEGVFNNSIPGYSIRVDEKGADGTSLKGIMIYDHTGNQGVAKIIVAKDGTMNTTKDKQYLILKLNDGVRYEESSGQNKGYDPRQQLTRMRFGQTEQKFDLSSFKMNRTDENSFRSNNQMLNLKGLTHKSDSLTKELDSVNRYARVNISNYYKQNNYTKGYTKAKVAPAKINDNILTEFPEAKRMNTVQAALDQANSIKQTVEGRIPDHDDKVANLIRIRIEYQRKFTLAVSCLMLFFIGAPLGAIIRKGGLGLPVVMAIIFFLFYHIISTVAEKSANQGNIHPVVGIWMAIIVLSPVGAFLTYKATVDSALFDLTYYKSLVMRIFKKGKTSDK
ncbi:lipopolysaccharide export system permease protein [Pedobacter cryoconitis]|uniref:Lipopolysaccharide export system permease protein n=1 Tax=Pedobacter cryoconitis TaxID=188932 RepID=A0A7W8YVF6_9SPHI|nr:LptF/LptG family permease [Pedobacter cryoconitis]MBB5622557.1 lipopolysaccharide export system permease protein [Pedobacter cryoconitis]